MKKLLAISIIALLCTGTPTTIALLNQNMEHQECVKNSHGYQDITNVNDSNEKLVLAFYYPWYLGHIYWPLRSPNRPYLGAYDSSDPEVIRQHIDWAKDASIDGFIVSWWGIDDFSDKNFEKILDIANERNFSASIYYETTKTGGKTIEEAKAEVITDLIYIIETYSSHPSFLKFECKPVIFVYCLNFYSSDFWEEVVDTVREKHDVFLMGDGKPTEYPYFDGYHTYNPVVVPLDYLLNSYLQIKEWFPDKLLAATVVPGFDDRKKRVLEGEIPKGYIPRYGGRTYNEFWNVASLVDPNWVLITSWNEWYEGTDIEPSRELGEQYLEATEMWSRVFKEGKPVVYFDKPTGNCLYVAEIETTPTPFGNTIIIGGITIGVNAYCKNGIDRVEFYIDGVLKNTDTDSPYEWGWNERAIGGHEIKVMAYDTKGNSASDDITVWRFL